MPRFGLPKGQQRAGCVAGATAHAGLGGHQHEERRAERALIGEYREAIESLLDTLDAGNHALALEIASVPEQIKGYGHVKARNLAAASSRWAGLREQWRRGEQAEVRVA